MFLLFLFIIFASGSAPDVSWDTITLWDNSATMSRTEGPGPGLSAASGQSFVAPTSTLATYNLVQVSVRYVFFFSLPVTLAPRLALFDSSTQLSTVFWTGSNFGLIPATGNTLVVPVNFPVVGGQTYIFLLQYVNGAGGLFFGNLESFDDSAQSNGNLFSTSDSTLTSPWNGGSPSSVLAYQMLFEAPTSGVE